MNVEFSKVRELPLDGLAELIEDNESEGFNFLADLKDEWHSGINRFDKEGEGLYQAIHCGELVGLCGLCEDQYNGSSRFGRLKKLYVSPMYRNRGVGSELVEYIKQKGRGRFSKILLLADTAKSDSFYRKLGFEITTQFNASTHMFDYSKVKLASLVASPLQKNFSP